MPINRISKKSKSKKISIADVLLAKYRTDPEGFRAYLPEVAGFLDLEYPEHRRSASPFGLTEHERLYRLQTLKSMLSSLNKESMSSEEATRALEHCAVLAEDDNLPYEIDYKVISQLVKLCIGKPLSDITGKVTINMPTDDSEETVNYISIIKGVVLNLSNTMRLRSITVNPQQMEERRKAMRIIALIEAHSNTKAPNNISKGDPYHATS